MGINTFQDGPHIPPLFQRELQSWVQITLTMVVYNTLKTLRKCYNSSKSTVAVLRGAKEVAWGEICHILEYVIQ